jgi:hypothetical protein
VAETDVSCLGETVACFDVDPTDQVPDPIRRRMPTHNSLILKQLLLGASRTISNPMARLVNIFQRLRRLRGRPGFCFLI